MGIWFWEGKRKRMECSGFYFHHEDDRLLIGAGIHTFPMLFFAGTRDTLCDLNFLKPVLDRLQAPWDLEVIEGGDHSFKVPKSHPISQQDTYQLILDLLRSYLA